MKDEILNELSKVSNAKWTTQKQIFTNDGKGILLVVYSKDDDEQFASDGDEVVGCYTPSDLTDDEIKVIAKHSDMSFEQIKQNLEGE